MKTKIILIAIMILLSVISAKAQFKINNTEPLSYGAYNTVTNAAPIIIGNDTIKAGGLRFEILKVMNGNDTGFSVNKLEPLKYGKYAAVINKNKLIIGSDTIPAQKITAHLVYILGTETIARTDKDNSYTGTNYFNHIIADTVTVNDITHANSTYWINGTDTLGWIDAARSDVVFFPKMTVGTLTTNTTVASTFIRSNQVQTDTLNIGNTRFFNSNGWIYTRGRAWVEDQFVTPIIFSWTNHTGSVGKSNNWYQNVFSDTVNSMFLKTTNAIFNPTTEPSNPTAGQIYFNSADNKFYGYNGTAWKQLDN